MSLIVRIWLLISIFNFICGIAYAKDSCDKLTLAGPSVKAYAAKLEEKILKKASVRERLGHLLKTIHTLDPIDNNKPDLQVQAAIAEKFGADELPNSSLITGILKKFGSAAEANAEIYRQVHNLYGTKGMSFVFFGPSAEEVIRLRIAFGCSHYARALKALIIETGTLAPVDVRYVAAVSTADKKKLCESKNQELMANGHQFLSVKIKGIWYYLNASSADLELIRQLQPFGQERGEKVMFSSLSKWPDNGKVEVTQIEQFNKLICDDSLIALREIYSQVCRK